MQLEVGSVCLVAILKDEEKFIDEWILYHKNIGIDHFFLYDDDAGNLLEEFMKPHMDYCTVVPWRKQQQVTEKQGNQIRAYNHALTVYIRLYKWVVFLDADEFIVFKKHKNIKSFLSGFEDASAVSLNWHTFGHNGFADDPQRLITTSLVRRMLAPSAEVKTISRTAAIENITYPHYCNLKYGRHVDANNREYTDKLYSGRTKVAHINHYQCRSFKQWMNRPDRGDVNFDLKFSPPEHKWRSDKNECLEIFIQTIARTNNEHTDRFMFKYRYSLQEGLANLNRSSYPYKIFSQQGKAIIDKCLMMIAQRVLSGEKHITETGLYQGKTGVAVFLFAYARYSGKPLFKKAALRLLREVSDLIDADSPAVYANGLAGYGTAIEYLVNKGHIKADTNEVLEDIDDLLHYKLISEPFSEINIQQGICGIGKYYVSRLNNPFNEAWHKRDKTIKEILAEIAGLLEAPFNTHSDFLSVIDLLSDALPHLEDKSKIKDYMAYAADKMETMVYEDMHFAVYPNNFNHLCAARVLLKAFNATGDEQYRCRAEAILKQHEEAQLLVAEASTGTYNAAQNMLHYIDLSISLNNANLAQQASKWLEVIMLSGTKTTVANTDLSLYGGLSGTGMAMLSVINNNTTGFLNLCPL